MSDCCENYTEEEKKKLNIFVTNTDKSIFAIRNLPEVVKGALFSRYSRSNLGLRQLLLKEFIGSPSLQFDELTNININADDQEKAIKKAEAFYDRVLDGYGDDSIGELGGAHLALENVSMIASKIIEDRRIGGAPLEKSTRYIFFDQKVNGDYRFLKEPRLMNSKHKDLYLETCRNLFDTYSKLIEPLTNFVETILPKEKGIKDAAYNASLRARVCDALRGLLPASTLTNIGIFGNGRFFENFIQKMHVSKLIELKTIGEDVYKELSKIIPSFVRRANKEHKHFKSYENFIEKQNDIIKKSLSLLNMKETSKNNEPVMLLRFDNDAKYYVASALMYENSNMPLNEILNEVRKLSSCKLSSVFTELANTRENRRHKLPRALEHADYTFDLTCDFGAFRDLHRHRILTQERELLTTDLGFDIPKDIIDAGIKNEYEKALLKANDAFSIIKNDYPFEAQYIVPMAYKIRWYFKINLRSLIWLTELRSIPQGHINYRKIAQIMAKKVMEIHPEFSPFFKFVDFNEYELGRLEQEVKSQLKKENTGK